MISRYFFQGTASKAQLEMPTQAIPRKSWPEKIAGWTHLGMVQMALVLPKKEWKNPMWMDDLAI